MIVPILLLMLMQPGGKQHAPCYQTKDGDNNIAWTDGGLLIGTEALCNEYVQYKRTEMDGKQDKSVPVGHPQKEIIVSEPSIAALQKRISDLEDRVRQLDGKGSMSCFFIDHSDVPIEVSCPDPYPFQNGICGSDGTCSDGDGSLSMPDETGYFLNVPRKDGSYIEHSDIDDYLYYYPGIAAKLASRDDIPIVKREPVYKETESCIEGWHLEKFADFGYGPFYSEVLPPTEPWNAYPGHPDKCVQDVPKQSAVPETNESLYQKKCGPDGKQLCVPGGYYPDPAATDVPKQAAVPGSHPAGDGDIHLDHEDDGLYTGSIAPYCKRDDHKECKVYRIGDPVRIVIPFPDGSALTYKEVK